MENSTGREYCTKGKKSLNNCFVRDSGIIVRIFLLAVLSLPLFAIMRNIFDPSDVDEISLSILPILLMVIYFVISKNILFEKNYEISDKEKVVKSKSFIITLVIAVMIQAGISFILPWYISTTGNNDVVTLINLYTLAVIVVNSACVFYLAYRYIKYRELGLATVLTLHLGIFATVIFAYDILRRISDPSVIFEFIFVLMPYLASVIFYMGIELYIKKVRR